MRAVTVIAVSVLIGAIAVPAAARAQSKLGGSVHERDVAVEQVFLEITGKTYGFSEEEEWGLAEAIYDAAHVEGLDPYMLVAIIRVESTFKRAQRSSVGALGLMQVRPSTGKAFAERAGVPWRGPRTLLDPESNIRIGAAYIAHMMKRFRGNPVLALTAYCHGPTRVRQYIRDQGHLTRDQLRYSRKVRKYWDAYRGPAPTPVPEA